MKLLTIILIIITVFLQTKLWFGSGGVVSIWQFRQKIVELEQENAKMTERNEILAAEIIDLQTGLAAIEEKSRNDYGLIKKNEIFYQLLPRSN